MIICAFLSVSWSGFPRGLSILLVVFKEPILSFACHLYWFSLPIELGRRWWFGLMLLGSLLGLLAFGLHPYSFASASQFPSLVATRVTSFYVSFPKDFAHVLATTYIYKFTTVLTPFYKRAAYCSQCPAHCFFHLILYLTLLWITAYRESSFNSYK